MSQPPKNQHLRPIANLLYEVGNMAKTPRSGFQFLGSGAQSVAEHANRTMFIGYVLAKLDGKVNTARVVEMCLLHDLSESRTSDLNYVHQKYVESDEEKAITELAGTLSFGADMVAVLEEFRERATTEAQLAKDADQLEFIISLKEQLDIGNARAKKWIPSARKRLRTPIAQQLADEMLATPSDEWWLGDPDDDWWVNRRGAGDNGKRY